LFARQAFGCAIPYQDSELKDVGDMAAAGPIEYFLWNSKRRVAYHSALKAHNQNWNPTAGNGTIHRSLANRFKFLMDLDLVEISKAKALRM
jgi:hypothetical protein